MKFIQKCLLFQGDSFDKLLGIYAWVNILAILISLIALLFVLATLFGYIEK